MKLRIKSMIWNIRKQKTTNQNNRKKKESKKKMRVVKAASGTTKKSNIRIIGVPKEQEEIGNLKKKNNENFPNLVKEIDMQVQEAERVSNKMDAKRPHHKTHHN